MQNFNIFSYVEVLFMLILNILYLIYYVLELTKQLLFERKNPYICVFITISIIEIIFFFAFVYAGIFTLDRTSFRGIVLSGPFKLLVDFVYFSTVTFTTLGFGDIAPMSSAAKITVIVEVLLFVVYISIILLNLANSRKQEYYAESGPNAEHSSCDDSQEGASSKDGK